MQPRIISLAALLMAVTMVAAQSIRRQEYWIDSDYGNRQQMGSSSTPQATISTANLSPGLHFFNHRAQNTDDEWGTLYRQPFYVPERIGSQVKAAEYWIDNNYANRQQMGTSTTPSVTISTDGLVSGLHFFNHRAQNATGQWGTLYRQPFYIPERMDLAANRVEYWIDNDYAHAADTYIQTPLNTDTQPDEQRYVVPILYIDLAQLAPGLHFFNHRAFNANGDAGCLRRTAFFIPFSANEPMEIAAYEYWIDNDAPTRLTDAPANGIFRLTLDVSQLPEGEHTFYFRAMNGHEQWGDLFTQKFTLTGPAIDYVITLDGPMRTFCADRDLLFADVPGMKAYVAEGFNTATGQVLLMRVSDVPAHTGLLLVGEPGTYHVPFNQSTTVYVNMFKGVMDDVTVWATEEGMQNYLLQGQQFQAVASQSPLSAEHAYLQVPQQAADGWSAATLHFDDTDGISDLNADGQTFDIYTLNGLLVKRQASTTKGLPSGIYIVNGKKVVIK